MHRAGTIAAVSKAGEHSPFFEIALMLMHLDHAVDSRERRLWGRRDVKGAAVVAK
jgi:hypothetical protein